MVAALVAHGVTAGSCDTALVRARLDARTTALVVVLTRAAAEVDLIGWAAGRPVRVVAVHGPTDMRGREAARRAGADVLLPRSGRTGPLVDAVLAPVTGLAASSAPVDLPGQPHPEGVGTLRSPR